MGSSSPILHDVSRCQQQVPSSAAHRSNVIKQTAKQINQICQNLISSQTNPKLWI
jgi:hypothetical protein